MDRDPPLFNGTVLNYFRVMGKISDPPAPSAPAKTADLLAALACTNTALRRAARQLGHLYDEALAPTGLKATQAALLGQIDIEGEAPTLQVLAERLAIRISALTHALRPLVRDGLVELRPDPEDGRTKRAVLTPLGQARLQQALVLWDAANRRVERVLGPAAATLRDLADEVASPDFLRAYAAGAPLAAT
jgi:DNA-binding MarR family transcriptional regulator